MDRNLVLAGLCLWIVHALLPGGMGRNVGGEFLLASYTSFWLFIWPLAFYRSAGGLRAFGYLTAPLLYAGVADRMPQQVWHWLGVSDVWFNAFGELSRRRRESSSSAIGVLTPPPARPGEARPPVRRPARATHPRVRGVDTRCELVRPSTSCS